MVMPEKLNNDGPASPNGKDDAGIVAELLKWVVGEFRDETYFDLILMLSILARFPRRLLAIRPG